jgi:hypothetical protein
MTTEKMLKAKTDTNGDKPLCAGGTVIVTTQEAEMGKIEVRSQPGQKVHKTLSREYPTQKKAWWSGSSGKSTCLPSVRPYIQTPVLKEKKKKNRYAKLFSWFFVFFNCSTGV